MKKVLLVATVVQKHINVFHLPMLKMFQEKGYKTYVAASNDTGSREVKIPYCDEYVEIPFKRNPLHPGNFFAYRKLKKLIQSGEFTIIHCHTPVGGLLGRMAAKKARKKGTRVIYTAHGFHFYKGAPRKNWMFYYPVEKFCARHTDVLITINHEDYALAQKKFKSKTLLLLQKVKVDSLLLH
jgi:glycosyltransferase EpsD